MRDFGGMGGMLEQLICLVVGAWVTAAIIAVTVTIVGQAEDILAMSKALESGQEYVATIDLADAPAAVESLEKLLK